MAVAITKKITGYSVKEAGKEPPKEASSFVDDANRRLVLSDVPTPPAASLRWEKRPVLAEGNPSQTYMVNAPEGRFAIVVGHVQNGHAYPFEAWVMGESPRGLTAIAKSLSMDMRSRDRAWLQTKLESLAEVKGVSFDLDMPNGPPCHVPGAVAAFAKLVLHRCGELGAFDDGEAISPVLDALMSRKEPKTSPDGGLAWYADVKNPITGDDFTLFLKEALLPDGTRRPMSIWLSGVYPASLDGLCKVLSYDLRVTEVEWGTRKLRQLLDAFEPNGAFRARIPGQEKTAEYPSTVAYIARLVLHRYTMLGLADNEGRPVNRTGVISLSEARQAKAPVAVAPKGALCSNCGTYAVIKLDGCMTCTSCGDSKCG